MTAAWTPEAQATRLGRAAYTRNPYQTRPEIDRALQLLIGPSRMNTSRAGQLMAAWTAGFRAASEEASDG